MIFRRKLAAKLQETEEELASALSKASSAEKAKNRLAGELEDAMIDLEKVTISKIYNDVNSNSNGDIYNNNNYNFNKQRREQIRRLCLLLMR